MKKIITLSILISCYLFSSGQNAGISGKVINANDSTPVYNAVVALILPTDSTIYQFTRTDIKGKFVLTDIPTGKYILMTSQPNFADLLDDININSDVILPNISLISKSTLLQEIIVNSGTPMRVKGDTTIYTADSFKVSANANVGELLKKLPGMQVDKNGKITAMGESVQKVLVDGEEFFGDDPGMAVKNLRADAVKEVQVFDKKSDQAEFTGIDDGNTQKTINLKLKEEAKKGYFGKIDLAGGPQKNIDNRYNTNLMASSFKGKRKVSAFLLNGNTGEDGLSWQDEQKYGGSGNTILEMNDDGGVMIFFGGNSDDEPYINTRDGFMTNTNAGLQYSNKWSDAYNLNIAPKYNEQRYINHSSGFTQTPAEDSLLNTNSTETSNVNRNNFKLRGTLEIKIDSMNSLKITANNNFYHTESENISNSITTGDNGTLKNSSSRQLQTNSDKHAFSGNILFKRKFNKARRTFSLSTNWNVMDNQGTNFLKSDNKIYEGGIISRQQLVDQMKNYDQSTKSLGASFVYTEPLSKNYSLELNYRLAYNYGTNDMFVFAQQSGKYNQPVDSLTNQFKQNILQNIPGGKINFSNKKLKANIGASFGFADFKLTDLTFNKDYNRNYVNFSPNAYINYNYKSNANIVISYRGSTEQPTINDLQPIRNNDDYFNQYLGNPDLKPSFNNSFTVSHRVYNFLTGIYTSQVVDVDFTDNAITSNRIIDLNSGKTVSRPVNISGSYSINFYSSVGFKIKKWDVSVDIRPGGSFYRSVGMTNNKTSLTKGISPNFSFNLSKDKEKKYSISLSNDLGYTYTTTNQNNQKTNYLNNTVSLNFSVYLKKVWSISSDYDYEYQGKRTQADKVFQTHILNAHLQRTFKDDEFTAYFSVRDLLNQNAGIDRNYYEGIYSQVINDRLKRYFMIGFTWNFKNRTTQTK